MTNHAADPFGIVGQVLDAQFRVDRLVGEGGFSAVYRGHHLGLQEPIAIKCLKLPPSLSPPLVDQFEKRFRDESRILYRLSQGNLNIVRSMAGGTWTAPAGFVVPFMVLEWMEGRSLANEFTIRRTVGQQGRSLQEVVKVFGPAGDGLGYAHSQGVIHRDLNPGNLFLANTPQGMRMKVLDFGVAKILDDAALNIGPRTQTVGQIRIFAPAYGAPEQFDDAIGKVGAASDVYAFALILMEALRDRCVNDGQHLGEFAQRAIDPHRRPTPRMLGLEVPDEVEQVFARATKLDPRERWQSARELWQALAIAVSAASEQKHQDAAFETPPLVMPATVVRTTQAGMAPPPPTSGSGGGVGGPGKTPGTIRIDKTMPIGTAMPHLNFPRPGVAVPAPPVRGAAGGGGGGGVPPSKPRPPPTVVTADQPHPPTQRYNDEATRIAPALSPTEPPPPVEPNYDGGGGDEDEVTRVHAPEPNVLRHLAEAEMRSKNLGQTILQSNSSPPRPAAGAPMMPAAGNPPRTPPPPAPPEAIPPSFGGTMMMQPGRAGTADVAGGMGHLPPPPAHLQQQLLQQQQQGHRPPSGQHSLAQNSLAQTMPLTGAHPLGLPTQGSAGGPLPAAGAPLQQQQHQQQPPQPQQQAPQQQQPPQQQMQQQQPMMPPQQAMMPPPPQPWEQQQHTQQQQQPMQPYPAPAFHQQPQGTSSGSMPPQSIAGVPKKGNPLLLVGIIVGALFLIGAIAGVFVILRSKGGDAPVGSTSASASHTPPIASLTPPPPTGEAPPPPVVEADAATAAIEVDAGAAAVTPTDTTPTPVPPTPVPPSTQTAATATTTAATVKDAGAPIDPNAFNEALARKSLGQANGVLVFCKKEGGVTGPGTASVTFNTDGTVGSVSMDPPYAGTPAGDCVTGQFRRQKVTPFQGSPQTIKHPFEVPK